MSPNNDTTPPRTSCRGMMGKKSGLTVGMHVGSFSKTGEEGLVKGPATGRKESLMAHCA